MPKTVPIRGAHDFPQALTKRDSERSEGKSPKQFTQARKYSKMIDKVRFHFPHILKIIYK
jgi:hypothetical protein